MSRYFIAALLVLVGSFAFAHATEMHSELIVRGENSRAITIKPKGEDEYAPLRWLDQNGNNVAQIVCHEKNSQGIQHNHCTWYTALTDRSDRTGRIDLTYGEDFANWTFESLYINFEKDAYIEPVLQSPDGTRWLVSVDNSGVLGTASLP